jgi:hypothetical protein
MKGAAAIARYLGTGLQYLFFLVLFLAMFYGLGQYLGFSADRSVLLNRLTLYSGVFYLIVSLLYLVVLIAAMIQTRTLQLLRLILHIIGLGCVALIVFAAAVFTNF